MYLSFTAMYKLVSCGWIIWQYLIYDTATIRLLTALKSICLLLLQDCHSDAHEMIGYPKSHYTIARLLLWWYSVVCSSLGRVFEDVRPASFKMTASPASAGLWDLTLGCTAGSSQFMFSITGSTEEEEKSPLLLLLSSSPLRSLPGTGLLKNGAPSRVWIGQAAAFSSPPLWPFRIIISFFIICLACAFWYPKISISSVYLESQPLPRTAMQEMSLLLLLLSRAAAAFSLLPPTLLLLLLCTDWFVVLL